MTLIRGVFLRSYRQVRSRLSTFTSESSTRCLSGEAKAGTESSENALRDKLFQNITIPEEGASVAKEVSSAATKSENSPPAQGLVSFVGNALLYGFLGTGAFVGYYQYRYSADEVENMVKESEKAGDGSFSIWNYVMRHYVDYRMYLENEMKKYADPPSDKLLPDLPPQARHIKTLVLDLDDVLIHSDWTRGRGWRTFKRPGAEEFIKDMAQYFELVVYTSQLPTYADPILDRLDPHRMIQYRLYRDSTNYINGKHVRDLSKLNRDLKQVLMITADTDAYSLQPGNAIKLAKWKTDNKDDTTLLDMLPFLEAIVRTNVPDVRAVVKSYEGEDIPTAFRKRMEKVKEAKKKGGKTPFFRGS
ncbi:hypothetical protein M9434_006442 [Picochlorum sp. BPE23]|nr:hypothetical protein M9434_006442 [Picochlorum sp. BPE23]KAI8109089.1 hypothetical protein M9435_005505 [Picochlorum sp. BPE23]